MDIRHEILEWIRGRRASTECGTKDITFETDILGEGILDSLAILNLVNWIEDRYGMEIADSDFDMENFRTIATIGAFIGQRRGMANR